MSTYEISKSSLLSLKAEILRKQQELSKAKVENEIKKKVLKKNPLEIKNKGVDSREKNDQTDVDEDLLKQSRSILEYKAKLYDKLSTEKQSEEDIERNKQYLVRFDKKTVEYLPPEDSEPYKRHSESDENCYESDDAIDRDPGEKWVDYVDCFGRTRKCMQKDLEYLKSKDKELEKIVEEKKSEFNVESEIKDNTKANGDISVTESEKRSEEESATNLHEMPEMSSSDMRRELLRQQWEKEEEELRNKSDIHYQDLLFGEARSHGTGYYGFSKDEEERAKQQEALRKLRQETETQQKKSQELKNSREKLLAARLKAARTRKRARMGLPPEEDLEPETVPPPEPPIENKESENQTESERLLGEARKNHVRPWDIGKEGVKEHQIMSQEEWVDKKREERPQEFAPPTIYRKNFRANIKQDETDETDTKRTLKFTSKQKLKSKNKEKNKYFNREKEERTQTETFGDELLKDYERGKDYEKVTEKVPTPMDSLNSLDFDDSLLRDYEKSIKKKAKIEIKLNYKQPPNIQPIPIDEDSDIEEADISVSDVKLDRGKGVEIAPPPTYDYYGPGQSKVRKKEVKRANIEQSINEGLKFLRKQVEEKEKSKKQFQDIFLF